MSEAIEFVGTVRLTPQQVAEAFWNMYATDQVEFYAHLHRIAGSNLCMQAQSIINTIAEADSQDASDAREGFCTLHDYATGYVDNATDWRAFKAKSDIRRMTQRALEQHA